MRDFEVILFNEAGETVKAQHLLLKDDLAALVTAQQLCSKNVVEVWDGHRRVVRVKRGNAPLLVNDLTSL